MARCEEGTYIYLNKKPQWYYLKVNPNNVYWGEEVPISPGDFFKPLESEIFQSMVNVTEGSIPFIIYNMK